MKKAVLILALCMAAFFSGTAKAEDLNIGDTLKSLPSLKQGLRYSITDSTWDYKLSTEVFAYKGLALEAGYSPNDEFLIGLSYPILKLKDLGVEVPILNLVEFNLGLDYGWKRLGQGKGNNESDFGASLSLLSLHF